MSEDRDISRQWALLRAGEHSGTKDDIPTRPTSVTVQAGVVRLALGESGELRALLPVTKHQRLRKLPTTTTLRLTETNCVINGHSARLLDMTCLSKELESVFSEVIEEILKRLESGNSVPDSVRTTLEDFRALLFSPTAGRKPIETILGLVGELIVLNNLLDISPEAWRAWVGPDGARHDFRAGKMAIEVKSTRSKSNSIAKIQSLEQLSEPNEGSLYLMRFYLESTPGGILSISRLYSLASRKCSAPEKLHEVLLSLECENPHSEEWNHTSFSLEGEEMYRVDHKFPRITVEDFKSGTLPPGVQEISYSIDLNQAQDSIITPTEKTKIEKELLACLPID